MKSQALSLPLTWDPGRPRFERRPAESERRVATLFSFGVRLGRRAAGGCQSRERSRRAIFLSGKRFRVREGGTGGDATRCWAHFFREACPARRVLEAFALLFLATVDEGARLLIRIDQRANKLLSQRCTTLNGPNVRWTVLSNVTEVVESGL